MLSTKHLLDPEENYNARSNALTLANGLKLAYNSTDQSLPWIKHAGILIKIALLEQIAKGWEIKDPAEIHQLREIIGYLPCIFRPTMNIMGEINTQVTIFNIFRQAYNEVSSLYPKLEVKTVLVEI